MNNMLILNTKIMPKLYNPVSYNWRRYSYRIKNGYNFFSKIIHSKQNIAPVYRACEIHTSNTVRSVDDESAHNVNDYTIRTHNCGELRCCDEGKSVSLYGWVDSLRMDKFILLRDAYGIIQIFCGNLGENLPSNLHLETVIKVEGIVKARPAKQINKKMPTGEIEIVASLVEIINNATPNLPFHIHEYNKANTATRNRYRFLALRFPEYQEIFRLRSMMLFKIREFLITNKKFVEVETPTLFKKTPGGAQEFVVPTHIKNKFYSLVQSPQQLKQLLMIGSVDRYFQIAKCYRDERTVAERQPEFTQLDLELSFTNVDGVIKLTEDILKSSWPCNKKPIKTPFPRISYQESMEKYGSDKPCVLDKFLIQDFKSYSEGPVLGYTYFSIIPNSQYIEKDLRIYINNMDQSYSKTYLLKASKPELLARKIINTTYSNINADKFSSEIKIEENDLCILSNGTEKWKTLETIGNCRRRAIDELGILRGMNLNEQYDFIWVLDFPLFEKKDGAIKATHHPFTQPHADSAELLSTDPLKVKSLAYDLVLNGAEVGGGSIRNHEYTTQKYIFDLLKLDESDFSHLMAGLSMGCPPHGGIALGIDRLIAILCNKNSIKDVIAFPKGTDGQDFMTDCPSDLPIEDKIRYHLS